MQNAVFFANRVSFIVYHHHIQIPRYDGCTLSDEAVKHMVEQWT